MSTALWINADHSIATYALPIIKELRANTQSHPATMTHEEWEGKLDAMIYGLEYVVTKDDRDYDEAELDAANEGLRLFGAWFQALWS